MESLTENLTPPYYTAVLNEIKGDLKDAEHIAPTAVQQPKMVGEDGDLRPAILGRMW